MMRWYNVGGKIRGYQTGGAVPTAPLGPTSAATYNVDSHAGGHSIANYEAARGPDTNLTSAERAALYQANMIPDQAGSNQQNIQGIYDYLNTGDPFAQADTSGIGVNQQAIQALQNQAPQDISGIGANQEAIAALQGRAPQDISGIGSNQAAIAALQGQAPQDISGIGQNQAAIAALQGAAGPDLSGIGANQQAIAALQGQAPQDISGIGSNQAAIAALQGQAPQDISGIGQNQAAIQALQNAPGQDISGIGTNQAAIAALQGRPEQDISGIGVNQQGIGSNQAAIQALQNAPGQDISGIGVNQQGIGTNQAAIQALQNAPQQDISGIGVNQQGIGVNQQGIGTNQAAIAALQNTPQQDISGIDQNRQYLDTLNDRFSASLGQQGQGGGVQGGGGGQASGGQASADGGFTPAVNTGVPAGGYANQPIKDYFAGGGAPIYSGDPAGAGVTGQPVDTSYVPPTSTYVPPAAVPQTPASSGVGAGAGAGANVNYGTARGSDVNTTGNYGGNNTVYDTNYGGSNGGLGFGAAGGVQNSVANAPGTLLNIPTWGQEANRVDQQVAEHDFTTEQVQEAANTLAGGTDLEGFTHQGQFESAAGIPGEVTSTAVDPLGNEIAYDNIDWNSVNAPNIVNTGGAADVQHDNLDALNAEYGAALSAIPNDGTATTEQRIAAAAANPAYNAEAAANHSQVAAGVGNVGPLGFTRTAENLTSADFDYVANQDANRNASQEDRNYHQYGLAGLSAAGAGIRNIGGANAQGGDNQGLPMEYMVLGDGTVYGPNGSEFSSVAEAQADAGTDAQQPAAQQGTAFETFLGQFIDTGPNSKYGHSGSRTDAQQAAFDQFHSGADQGSVTAARGQAEGQENTAVTNANAIVNQQAQEDTAAQGDPAAQAQLEQERLLARYADTSYGVDTSQQRDNYFEQAVAAGLDTGGLSASEFNSQLESQDDYSTIRSEGTAARQAEQRGIVSAQHQAQRAATGADDDQSAEAQQAYQNSVQTADQTQYDESVGRSGVQEANRLANQSGSSAVQATGSALAPEQQSAAAQMLQAGVPAEVVRQTVAAAEPTPTPASNAPAQSPAVQDSLVANHGYTRQPDGSIRSPYYDILGYNTGGFVSPEELRRKQMEQAQQTKIAQSRATATPAQPKGPLQAQQVGGGQSPLLGIGAKLLGTAVGGPFGALLGGLFNEGGKVDYAELLKKKLAEQAAAAKAGASGQTVAPTRRALFNAQGQDIGQISGDVIEGYAGRAKQGETAGLVDPFEGISAQIKAAQAAGKPVDYNSLAALQHARSSGNKQKEEEAMRAFLAKNPSFAMPGGSQGVVLKNMGGPISANPHGYNEGGSAQSAPIKKVMDMEKLESQKKMDEQKMMQADKAFMKGEERKDAAARQAMMQKEEAHKQSMKLKADTARMGPLAKQGG